MVGAIQVAEVVGEVAPVAHVNYGRWQQWRAPVATLLAMTEMLHSASFVVPSWALARANERAELLYSWAQCGGQELLTS